MGAVLSRKVVTTDASLMEQCPQRSVCERQLERGLQSPPHTFPGAFSGFSLPEIFFSVPAGTSCPGSTNNTTVAYINWQGGACAPTGYAHWHIG